MTEVSEKEENNQFFYINKIINNKIFRKNFNFILKIY